MTPPPPLGDGSIFFLGPAGFATDADLPATREEMLRAAVEICVDKRHEDIPELIEADRLRCREVEAAIRAKWGEALWTLEALIVEAERALRLDWTILREHSEAWTPKSQVLTALIRRCCETSREILALIHAGLSLGAHARWRTLHELATTAHFIALNNEELAERFLAHRIVEETKDEREMSKIRKSRATIEDTPPDPERLKSLEVQCQAVINKYGKDIKENWGWTASVLPKGQRHFGGIRQAVLADAALKGAHAAVHASAGAPFWSENPNDARWPPNDYGHLAPAANVTRELKTAFMSYGLHLYSVAGIQDMILVGIGGFVRLCDEVLECLLNVEGISLSDLETEETSGDEHLAHLA